jgi:multiple sugar transport system permease protein
VSVSSSASASSLSAIAPRDNARGYFQRRHARRRLSFILLVAPAVLWFLGLMLWPLLNMFYLSFFRWDSLLGPRVFIGLDNFIRLFQDDQFYRSLKNAVIYLLVELPVVLIPAYILGFMLSQRPPGYRLFRFIFFSPSMLSVAAINMLFLGIYLPDGILNTVLTGLGLSSLTHVWLADPKTALGSLIAIDIWGNIGFFAVMFFAALSGLPEELFEAARLDGASAWDLMWRIAFPLTLDFFGVAMVLQYLWLIYGTAQNVLILTHGGPGDRTFTLGFMLYEQAFSSKHLGYSQAIGVFLFVVGLVGILTIRRFTRRRDIN